jgi:hypothetical protein
MADDIYNNKDKINPPGRKQAIQIFVMSWHGLSMYDPSTGKNRPACRLSRTTQELQGAK